MTSSNPAKCDYIEYADYCTSLSRERYSVQGVSCNSKSQVAQLQGDPYERPLLTDDCCVKTVYLNTVYPYRSGTGKTVLRVLLRMF